MEQLQVPTDERFTWTMALIDATLALRFKDEQLRDDIERARGNEAKRKAWHALAQRLQKEQGISMPEAKLRRVISKWQSQHRSWTQAVATKNASELALMERPPTYMPALQRYFKDESKGSSTESAPWVPTVLPQQPTQQPTTIPCEDEDDEEPSTPSQPLPKRFSMGEPPKRPQRPAMVYDVPEPKQRKLSPQKPMETVKEAPKPAYTSIPSPVKAKQPAIPVANEDNNALASLATVVCQTPAADQVMEVREPEITETAKSRAVRDLVARAAQRLSDIQKEQLTLQKAHFEEQLAMQRKQYDEQFAVQRKQVEAVHTIFESLLGSVDV